MESRVFSANARGRIVDVAHEHEDGSVTFETKQNISEIIEENKATKNHFDERSNWKGEFHRVASIPLTVWWEWVRKGWTRDEKKLKSLLNDPDNAVFRTRPGRI